MLNDIKLEDYVLEADEGIVILASHGSLMDLNSDWILVKSEGALKSTAMCFSFGSHCGSESGIILKVPRVILAFHQVALRVFEIYISVSM